MAIVLTFQNGTLLVDNATESQAQRLDIVWDERVRQYRTEARNYRHVVMVCKENSWPIEDGVKTYSQLTLEAKVPIKPREHQVEALQAWTQNMGLGVVQLPTGAGKTFLAILAILEVRRPTLILVPTIDLVHQWFEVLGNHIDAPIGMVGGGHRQFEDITVSTYDSGVLFYEHYGHRFGFLVVDECHHLPAPQYRNVAIGCIAPFRLGLTATVERVDGKEEDIYDLLGPKVHEGRIDQLENSVLAPYEVINCELPMEESEMRLYQERRLVYTTFLRRYNIRFSEPNGWRDFLIKSARMPGGREAMKAYRDQKKLAQASSAKLKKLWEILQTHKSDRIIIFTDDNDMAYRIGRSFLLPVITHQTKLGERRDFLAAFRSGEQNIMVTSKVLNEGVDVPDARIGVVVSGSGAVREHVQRLGRLLRHRPGKTALLYELVSAGTGEQHVNRRRKQHHAYQRFT